MGTTVKNAESYWQDVDHVADAIALIDHVIARTDRAPETVTELLTLLDAWHDVAARKAEQIERTARRRAARTYELNVVCPECNAGKGELCVTPGGNLFLDGHLRRRKIAQIQARQS